MSKLNSASSQRQLLSPDPKDKGRKDAASPYGEFFRATSALSTSDINFPKVIDKTNEVGEQTLYQVEITNEKLLRKTYRSEMAAKKKCLTRRWQTALAAGVVLGSLIAGIIGLAYWLSVPKVITQPYLLYGESCYMNSRSCDATRGLWCPAGTCICTGNYQWNATVQNCTCGTYSSWNGLVCQGYGHYGDPCNAVQRCLPTLTCAAVINQTYTTGQQVCECDNATYLDTSSSPTKGTCIPRLPYNSTCLTADDCQNWLGLSCLNTTTVPICDCDSAHYWDPVQGKCVSKVLGWDPCNTTVPCDTSRGLTCVAGLCECNSYSFWDNVTTINCQQIKTYAINCQYNFQCNTSVSLSCPSVSTGCNCPKTSYSYICDCQSGNFWDGLRCTPIHIFNGTCPGQYACSANLVCYLGHCICPGNMVWNLATAPNACSCSGSTSWNPVLNTCQ